MNPPRQLFNSWGQLEKDWQSHGSAAAGAGVHGGRCGERGRSVGPVFDAEAGDFREVSEVAAEEAPRRFLNGVRRGRGFGESNWPHQ